MEKSKIWAMGFNLGKLKLEERKLESCLQRYFLSSFLKSESNTRITNCLHPRIRATQCLPTYAQYPLTEIRRKLQIDDVETITKKISWKHSALSPPEEDLQCNYYLITRVKTNGNIWRPLLVGQTGKKLQNIKNECR